MLTENNLAQYFTDFSTLDFILYTEKTHKCSTITDFLSKWLLGVPSDISSESSKKSLYCIAITKHIYASILSIYNLD